MVNSTLTSYDLLLLEFCPLLYCHYQKDTAPPFGTLQLITSIFCCKARQIYFFLSHWNLTIVTLADVINTWVLLVFHRIIFSRDVIDRNSVTFISYKTLITSVVRRSVVYGQITTMLTQRQWQFYYLRKKNVKTASELALWDVYLQTHCKWVLTDFLKFLEADCPLPIEPACCALRVNLAASRDSRKTRLMYQYHVQTENTDRFPFSVAALT